MSTRRKYWLHISSTSQATAQVSTAVSPQTARNFGLVLGRGEEFKLDVVRIPEHEDRAVGLVGYRRLGQWLVGRIGAHDAVGFEVFLPDFQVCAGGDDEARMVQACCWFGEEMAVVG